MSIDAIAVTVCVVALLVLAVVAVHAASNQRQLRKVTGGSVSAGDGDVRVTEVARW